MASRWETRNRKGHKRAPSLAANSSQVPAQSEILVRCFSRGEGFLDEFPDLLESAPAARGRQGEKAVASLGAVGLQQPQAVVMVQSTHRTPASLENSWDAVNLGHRKSLFAKQLQT